MKKVVEIILIILFFLQGTKNLAGIVLIVLILFCSFFLAKKKIKITFPSYLLLGIVLYSFYLLLGLYNNHPRPHIDIKYQIYSFFFFFGLLNLVVKIDFLAVLFKVNLITCLIYILLFYGLFPNIWHEATFGRQGRVLGPAVISIVLILFYYLFYARPFDKKLGIALSLSFVYLLMTSNFTNILIVFSLVALIVINFKKLFQLKYVLSVFFLTILVVVVLQSSFVPDMVTTKMEFVLKPWEYGSIKTRIQDLNQALVNENFTFFEKIFGEGYGVGSKIYRENEISPSLSKTLSFQEIDNGFYYLYHRGGWSLLLLFLLSHLLLLFKSRNIKAKFGFIIIVLSTNLLSIHYFNYMFYLLIPFLIICKNYKPTKEYAEA